jgi:protein tyrosine phosphatase (PTP) superfamily phosphohydrolase (DUF442 family)
MTPHSVFPRIARYALQATALSCVVVAHSTLGAQAENVQTSAEQSSIVATAPDMVPNFEKVNEGLWRGSAPSSAALDALKHDGVKTIVDLRLDGDGVESESAHAKKLGVKYFHFPLSFKTPGKDELKQILSVMTDPVNQPVFIHCRQGADRTGLLVGLYRREWQGWNFKRTYAEMRQHHFKPFLFNFKHQVERASANQPVAALPQHLNTAVNNHVFVSQQASSL